MTWTHVTNINGPTGPTGPTGPQGLPGTNAVPADEAVAGYVSTTGTSATKTALGDRYVGKGEPWISTTNYVYVSPTGSDLNDGLSAATPFATFQAAFDYLAKQGPVLQGFWEVVAAAGTYPYTGSQQTLSTRSVNRVVIRGAATAGHPAVPTTIIDGAGGAAYKHGLSASGIGVRAEFRDLLFTGFTAGVGDNSRIGCLGESEADVFFNNVHATGASWTGVYAFNTVRARITGGVFDGCRSGIIANDTQATVIDSIVRNSTESGIYWSRGSQGHVDYVTLEDNPVGLRVAENSRVDTVAVNFRRNAYAVRTQTGGVFGEGGAPNIYNRGTADANTQADVEYSAFSGDSKELEIAQSPVRVAYDRGTYTHTGSTALTQIAAPYTIKANRLKGVGKSARVVVFGVLGAATAGSTLTVGFGGLSATITVAGADSNAPFLLDITLLEVAGGYRSMGSLTHGLNKSRLATSTAGFVVGSDQPVTVSATLAATSDSVTVYRTDVYITG